MFSLFVRTYQAWREPRPTPIELPRLNDAQLHDLGLVRNDAAATERKQVSAR
jgi:uncharacterized protein YjiS (DUF1127 family)